MHRLLKRQLKKLGLYDDGTINPEAWRIFLQYVDRTYSESDRDRYTLERSLSLSSEEMQELYRRQKNSFEVRQSAILAAVPDLLILLDEDGRYVEILAGKEAGLLYGNEEDILGKTVSEILPDEIATQIGRAINSTLNGKGTQLVNYPLNVPAGSKHFEARLTPTGFTAGDKATVLCLARDITDIQHAHDELNHVASHDTLTGLANRRLFEERLDQALSRARRNHSQGALLFLDLDRFKMVNDSLGHGLGDQLLCEAARRLASICRLEDTVARFGGDEFVILIEDHDQLPMIYATAEKILKAFNKSFDLPGYDLDVTTSIGIALYPRHGQERDKLIKHADAAMYAAKESGRNRYHLFTHELSINAEQDLALVTAINRAIIHEEFYLEYQPQYQLHTGRLSGFEALIRWRHPERGLICPSDFIPAAESTGSINRIGRWVLQTVCERLVDWSKRELPFGTLSINLSQRQLSDPDFYSQFMDCLENTGAKSLVDRLECEITESEIFMHTDLAFNNLMLLTNLGIHLAIDDFGTGHSSLINLKLFPLNRLKIDRSFVRDVGTDPSDESIIQATIALAQGFSLEVVAEGVETLEQETFLRRLGCHHVQGFYYHHPLSQEDSEHILEALKKTPDGATPLRSGSLIDNE